MAKVPKLRNESNNVLKSRWQSNGIRRFDSGVLSCPHPKVLFTKISKAKSKHPSLPFLLFQCQYYPPWPFQNASSQTSLSRLLSSVSFPSSTCVFVPTVLPYALSVMLGYSLLPCFPMPFAQHYFFGRARSAIATICPALQLSIIASWIWEPACRFKGLGTGRTVGVGPFKGAVSFVVECSAYCIDRMLRTTLLDIDRWGGTNVPGEASWT
jgi:hypothetical protein